MDNLIKELVKQYNYEIESEFIYLAISSFYAKDFPGICNFFVIQAHEERIHAMKFYRKIVELGHIPVLDSIKLPEISIIDSKTGFDMGFDHEKFITSRIKYLVDLSKEANAVDVERFLEWFVEEQEEEEESFEKIITRIVSGESFDAISLELGKRRLEYHAEYI